MGELNLYVTAHHLVSPLPHAPIGVLCPYRHPLLTEGSSLDGDGDALLARFVRAPSHA